MQFSIAESNKAGLYLNIRSTKVMTIGELQSFKATDEKMKLFKIFYSYTKRETATETSERH